MKLTGGQRGAQEGMFYSYGQIGKILGFSPQRAQQLEKSGLEKLRHIVAERRLTFSDLNPKDD